MSSARSTIVGLLLLAALVSAIVGQYLLAGRSDQSLQSVGLLCYLLALVCFGSGVWAARSLGPASTSQLGLGSLRSLSSRGSIALVSALLMLVVLMVEKEPAAYVWSLFVWIASMVLALAAAIRPGEASRGLREWRVTLSTWIRAPEAIALIGIVLVGAALRLVSLAAFPSGIHGDETEFGLIAGTILSGNGPNPFGTVFLGDPALFVYLEAPFLALLGQNITALRLCAAVAGILTIPFFFLLLRKMFGVRPALLGTALIAGSAVDVHYSRLALNVPEGALLGCLAVWALWSGFESRRGAWWLASGMLGGLALYFHFAARLFPLVLALFTLYLLVFRRREWRSWVSGGGMAFLGGVMALAPMGLMLATRGNEFTGHMTDRLIFNQWSHVTGGVEGTSPLNVLATQFKVNLLAFVSWPDSGFYGFAGTPLLTPLLGPLVVLGIALILFRVADPRYALMAIWFWVFIIIDGVITIDSPQSHRLLGALFPAIAGVALVMDWLLEVARRIAGDAVSPILMAVPILVPLLAAYSDNANYFGPAAAAKPWEVSTSQANYVASIGSQYRVYTLGTPGIYFSHGATRFLAPQTEGESLHNPGMGLPAPAGPDKNLAFLVYSPMAGYLPVLESLYPEGKEDTVSAHDGQRMFTAFKVDGAIAAHGEGLLAKYGDGERVEVDAGSLGQTAAVLPSPVEWTGSLFIERAGNYQLFTEGPPAEISLDGSCVGGTESPLAAGWHSLSIRSQLSASSSRLALRLRTPGKPPQTVPGRFLYSRSLVGNIRSRVTDTSGSTVESWDRAIGFRNLSDVSTMQPPATFVWDAVLTAPKGGRYQFDLNSTGEAELFIDQKAVASNGAPDSGLRNAKGGLDLQAGPHEFRLRYSWQKNVMGMVEALWMPPGGQQSIIPPDAFGRAPR